LIKEPGQPHAVCHSKIEHKACYGPRAKDAKQFIFSGVCAAVLAVYKIFCEQATC